MVNKAIVVPCAALGAIVGVGLVFIYWWFPRTWNKGNGADTEAIGLSMAAGDQNDGLTPDERRRLAGQRAREYLAAIEERNQARKEGREFDKELPVYYRP